MSAAAVLPCLPCSGPFVLPFVWAIGAELPAALPSDRAPELEIAFYRKYTEALLRRYVRMSMEAGKVPSLLGQEMFRGKVTNYRIGNFDDVVIFLHDVERCLAALDLDQRQLIERLSLQQYTVGETAELLGLKPRTVIRRYGPALDRLTRIFLAARMLESLKSCQGGLS